MPSGQAKILYIANAFLFLMAVVYADVLWGSEFSILLFYLIPIAWTAWLAGRGPALSIAVATTFARFGREVVGHWRDDTSLQQLIWSVSTELVFFLVFTVMTLKLQQLLEDERKLARSDPLTQLLNARAFREMVSAERERLVRYGRTMSLVYLDLDNFKSVNDKLGHHTGDLLLKAIAAVLKGNTRQVDVASRLGGDEFALLLPETDEDGATIVLNRLRDKIKESMDAKGWPVTGSIGCVTFHTAPDSMDRMLQEADAAMYRSKKSGKNKIDLVVWDERLTGEE